MYKDIYESDSDSKVNETYEGTQINQHDNWMVFEDVSEAAQLVLHLR